MREIWRCMDCGEQDFDPVTRYTSYESYYGVSCLFSNSTPLQIDVCPFCGSDNIEQVYIIDEDEEEEE